MQELVAQASQSKPASSPRTSSDHLDRQLRRAEDAIRRKAWGAHASVVLRCGFDEEGGGHWQQSLCFGEMDGYWRLYVESGFTHDPSSMRQDLFAADLETRLLAAEKVPLLIEALQGLQATSEERTSSVARELATFIDRFLRTDC